MWIFHRGGVRIMVFNATFNNISGISWRSVLFVEETTDLSQVTDKLYHMMLYQTGFKLTENLAKCLNPVLCVDSCSQICCVLIHWCCLSGWRTVSDTLSVMIFGWFDPHIQTWTYQQMFMIWKYDLIDYKHYITFKASMYRDITIGCLWQKTTGKYV